MRRIFADCPRLHRPLVLFLALSLAGGTILWTGLDSRQQAWTRKTRAQDEERLIQERLGRIREEEKEIQAHVSLFQRLENQGLVGEEKRLDWVELLQDLRDRRHLAMEYEFSPRRPLLPASGQESWEFHASALDLGLELLHEEDLTGTLDELRRHAKALVRVRSCTMSWSPTATSRQDETAPRLQAQCRLEWITLAKTASAPRREGSAP